LLLLNNQIVQATGTLQLKASFPNPADRLWPGELVNVRLLIDTRHDGLTVGSTAVQEGPEGKYAFVVKSDDTMEIRCITTTHPMDGLDLVDSGLKAGETVVVEGQSRLQPGSRVTILTGKAASLSRPRTHKSHRESVRALCALSSAMPMSTCRKAHSTVRA